MLDHENALEEFGFTFGEMSDVGTTQTACRFESPGHEPRVIWVRHKVDLAGLRPLPPRRLQVVLDDRKYTWVRGDGPFAYVYELEGVADVA
jgi:hypothetical protein